MLKLIARLTGAALLCLAFTFTAHAEYVGDYLVGDTVCGYFNTYQPSTGASFTLASGAIRAYKDGSATEDSDDSGLTLDNDFDGVTGYHQACVDTSQDGTFYSANSRFSIILDAGTVDSISVVGTQVLSFSLQDGTAGAILTDTGTTLDDYIDTEVADILTDTSTTLDDFIDTEISTLLEALIGLGAEQTADSGTTTTIVDAALTQATDDWFKGMGVHFTSGTLLGQDTCVTGFTAASDTLTFSPAVTTAVTTHNYYLLPHAECFTSAGGAGATAQEVWEYSTRTLTALDEDTTTLDLNATAVGSLTTFDEDSTTIDINATTIGTVTTLTGHTAQTGDAYARLGAPAGASVSADIAAIEAQTDDIGAAGAGLTALATQTSVNTIDDFLDTEIAALVTGVNVSGISGDTTAADNFEAWLDLIVDNGNGAFPPYGVTGSGTAQTYTAGTPSLTLAASTAAADDDLNGNTLLVWGSNEDDVQVGCITDYAGATDIATLSSALTTAPTGTIRYVIYGTAACVAEGDTLTADDVWTHATRTLTALDEDTTTLDLNATTIGTVTTATNVTTVNGLAANVLTAASAAADLTTELQSGLATASALTAVDDFVDTEIATLIEALIGLGAEQTADSGTTTTIVDAALTQATDDWFKGSSIIFTSGTLNGQDACVTGFTAATDTLTFAPATTTAVTTHNYYLLPSAECFSGASGSGATAQEVWEYATRGLTILDEDTTTLDLNSTVVGSLATFDEDSTTIDINATTIGTATNVTTVNGLAADTLTAAAAAADLTTELQSGLATAAALATVDDYVDTEVADILTDTSTTLDDLIDTEIATIVSQTAAATLESEANDALVALHLDHLLAVTYDPASEPGVADALLNELVESDAGVARFTANALEQAPTGSGASVEAIADEVETRTIAGVTTVGTVNALAANSITAAATAADFTTEVTSGLATAAALDAVDNFVDTEIATLQTSVDDIPTNAELATALGTADDAVLTAIDAVPTAAENRAEMDSSSTDLNELMLARTQILVATADSGDTNTLTDTELTFANAQDIDGAYVVREDGQRCFIDSFNPATDTIEFAACVFTGAWSNQQYRIYPAGTQ